jgi:hypothetical protein
MKNDQSLLSKIYGIYTLELAGMQNLTCFIMDNLFGKDYQNIERIYDLKGSK